MKFSKQLQKIMQHFGLSTTELADKISVPKATISHLISERNKPSLEFIMKLHTTFSSLNLEWLIYEKEPFLVNQNTSISNEKSQNEIHVFEKEKEIKEELELRVDDIETKNIDQNVVDNQENILSFQDKKIDSIVIFYSDGSFKKYNE